MDRAVILVGTETWNAEDVADELAGALEETGFEVETLDMEEADTGAFDGRSVVVVCTSTYGDGELPMNSEDLYEALSEGTPDLGGVLFAVCALGDSAYPEFCEAGKMWSRLLADLGAEEVVGRHEIDAGPDEEDIEGAREWAGRIAEEFAAAVK